jgi:hypothetical protein
MANLHTLQITVAHARPPSVMSFLAVAWLESSLRVTRLWLLTMEVLLLL